MSYIFRTVIVLFTALLGITHVNASQKEDGDIRIVIFGESFQKNVEKSGFNQIVLTQLLDQIKKEQPDAVFFSGNMVLGVEENDEVMENVQNRYNQIPPWEEGLTNRNGDEEKRVFNKQVFLNQLKTFSSLLSEKLGEEIPFYPIGGSQEEISPESGKLFGDHFGLKTEAPEFLDSLAYSVSIENTFFLLLPTSKFDSEKERIGEFPISNQYLKWLDQVLSKAAKDYPYVFVIGNKPAYSTTATYGLYRGLEKRIGKRNRFWDILRKNGVVAYFSGYEPLFDRSIRRGVWQVISGGGGAPFSQRFAEQTFYHFLLLTLPKGGRKPPVVEVIDIEGRVREKFELEFERTPLYQFRIS